MPKGCIYSKTRLKRPLKKKTKIWFSRPIIAKCRSEVLQNAPREHSAILSTFIKLLFVFNSLPPLNSTRTPDGIFC